MRSTRQPRDWTSRSLARSSVSACQEQAGPVSCQREWNAADNLFLAALMPTCVSSGRPSPAVWCHSSSCCPRCLYPALRRAASPLCAKGRAERQCKLFTCCSAVSDCSAAIFACLASSRSRPCSALVAAR